MNGLAAFSRAIDRLNEQIGRGAAWFALAMVLLQFVVVVMRYVFGVGSILMQEGVIYLHAALFLCGASYTLLHGGHVRVDILYRGASPRKKAVIDLFGTIFLLLPVCAIIAWAALPYVEQSWGVLEGSKETSGIPGVFVLKSLILLFVALMALQGVSLALRSILTLSGHAPEDEQPQIAP